VLIGSVVLELIAALRSLVAADLPVATTVEFLAVAGIAELASITLIFFIARRLGTGRVGASLVSATAAAAMFVASLLAPEITLAAPVRAIASSLILAAVLLSQTRARQLAGHAGAALAFGIAVAIDPLTVVALPALAWMLWRAASPSTRRYTLAVAVGAFLLIVVGAGVTLAITGLPVHSGLLRGVLPSASLDGGDRAGQAAVATPLLWAAVATAALGVCCAVAVFSAARRSLRPLVIVALAVAGVMTAFPAVGQPMGATVPSGAASPLREAERWVEVNMPAQAQVIADGATVADLGRDGIPSSRMAPAAVAGTVPDVSASGVGDYLVVTGALRAAASAHPVLAAAVKQSTAVARFGSDQSQVVVRRIESQVDATAARVGADRAAARAGSSLALNPNLRASDGDRSELAAGRVDTRVSLALGQFLATDTVTISGFPRVSGDTGSLARQVLITSVGGASTRGETATASAVSKALHGAPAAFRSLHVTPTVHGLLVTYPTEPFISGN
jgi:hypothetical protein